MSFEFNSAAVTPQTEVEIAPRASDSILAVTPVTDAERIAAARLRAIARCRETNRPGAVYSWEYPDSYYRDFAGAETSRWDAGVLICLADILEVPKLRQSRWDVSDESYDAQTGLFNLSDAPAVSIQELKMAVQNRIAELGLSPARVWEWFSDVREPRGQEYWRFNLATRIQRFRAA